MTITSRRERGHNVHMRKKSTCVAPTDVTHGLLAGKSGVKGVGPSLALSNTYPDRLQLPTLSVGKSPHVQLL